MKIIVNNVIPFKGFAAINLFGALFVRKGVTIGDRLIRHEAIHTRQIRELLYAFFYLAYLFEWLVKLIFHGKEAYRNISFEREAYANEGRADYLANRPPFAFIKRIFK